MCCVCVCCVCVCVCVVCVCVVCVVCVVCMHVCSVCSSPDCSVHSILLRLLLCRDIMLLSNTVIYDHQLQAGSSTVAMATLNIPHWSSTSLCQSEMTDGPSVGVREVELPHWLLYALDPSHPVVFVDTDKVIGLEGGKEEYTLQHFNSPLYMTGCLGQFCLLDLSSPQLHPPILSLSPVPCSIFSLLSILYFYTSFVLIC